MLNKRKYHILRPTPPVAFNVTVLRGWADIISAVNDFFSNGIQEQQH